MKAINARAMSWQCMSGRQGEPSDMIRISRVAIAQAKRLLTTRSVRNIGECPYAVAFRKYAGVKVSSASDETACSVSIFDLAYAVRGLSGSFSSRSSFSPAPYTEQLAANK